MQDGVFPTCLAKAIILGSSGRMDVQDQQLLAAAREVRKRAYAPYSNYCVGAALITVSGEIIAACNVENQTLSLTVCAERACLCQAIALGHRKFTKMVIVTQNGGTPCGGCRQFIVDLCANIPIITVDEGGKMETHMSLALLPQSFKLNDPSPDPSGHPLPTSWGEGKKRK